MFQRFVLWLVSKFVSDRGLFEFFVTHKFIKDPRRVISDLFRVAVYSDAYTSDFPSSNKVALTELQSRFTLSELTYLHALATIKSDLMVCANAECAEDEYLKFFQKVNEVKAAKNLLKVRKDLIALVRSNCVLTHEEDVEALATILQQHHIDPDAAAYFIIKEV